MAADLQKLVARFTFEGSGPTAQPAQVRQTGRAAKPVSKAAQANWIISIECGEAVARRYSQLKSGRGANYDILSYSRAPAIT